MSSNEPKLKWWPKKKWKQVEGFKMTQYIQMQVIPVALILTMHDDAVTMWVLSWVSSFKNTFCCIGARQAKEKANFQSCVCNLTWHEMQKFTQATLLLITLHFWSRFQANPKVVSFGIKISHLRAFLRLHEGVSFLPTHSYISLKFGLSDANNICKLQAS